ncbi:putative hemolysin [Palleronia sp. KMU-117]|uniref:putative hemolysin n=1 Tax=Palleronia sp. KMU-117 TaxID=3434108 RepID=UPI003D760485
MKSPTILLPLALAGASACSVQSDQAELANPAATFCVAQGGTYALSQPDGSGGTCTLPDGSVVDVWDYYRANASTGG